MKYIVLFTVLFFSFLFSVFSQEELEDTEEAEMVVSETNITDNADPEGKTVNPQSEDASLAELEQKLNDSFLWRDPILVQFNRMLPRLAASLGRLDNRISTLAVSNLYFDPKFSEIFRKVANTKIYGNLLAKNPALKLVKCEECNQIKSSIENGILKISRGIGNKDDRKKLAKELNVQGFMTGDILLSNNQVSIVVTVYDAEEGRIILSDMIVGARFPDITYYNVYTGAMQIPMDLKFSGDTLHRAILIGIEETMRFAEYGLFSISLALIYGFNDRLEEEDKVDIAGLSFGGDAIFQIPLITENQIEIAVSYGLGQFLVPAFNYSMYHKIGGKVLFGQTINFGFYYYMFSESNAETPENGLASKTKGVANSLVIGWQF